MTFSSTLYLFNLGLAHRVRAGSKDRVASRERLGSGTHTLQDLGVWHSMRLDAVVRKVHQVTLEALDLALSNEAENIHLSVQAVV